MSDYPQTKSKPVEHKKTVLREVTLPNPVPNELPVRHFAGLVAERVGKDGATKETVIAELSKQLPEEYIQWFNAGSPL